MKRNLLLLPARLFLLICLPVMMVLFAGAQQPTQTQRIKVQGRVLSGETRMPLPGASVSIKGSKRGVTTDSTGKFSITVNKGQTIVIGFVGFENKEYKISEEAKDLIIASLNMLAINTEEVVVVGYGTRKKSHLTGAVSKVSNDSNYLGMIPVSRADDALMGKMAGVSITMTDAQAGAAPTIQIRGATSITAGTDPLIVIDGYPVPTDLSAIDMNDVESIEVLKDAASAAIYGSRGGNGVILITTKSGKSGKGRISLNVSTGLKNVYRKIPTYTLQSWKQFVLQDNNGVLPASGEIAAAEKFDGHTNAQDVIFRQVNFTNAQLSASGGNANFRYYLSGNMLLDNGIMLGNDYKRFGLRAGFNAKVNPRVTIDFGFTPSYTEFYNVPVTVQEALRTLPAWMPVYHTDTTSKYTGLPVGSIANMRDFYSSYNPFYTGPNLSSATTNNPLQQLGGTTDRTTQVRNITNFSVKYDFSPYLSFKSTVGALYNVNTRNYFQKSWAQAEAALDGEAFARSTSKAILNKITIFDFSNENMLNYKRIFGKHDIDAIAVFSTQYTNTTFTVIQVGNFATDDIMTLNAGTFQSLNDTAQDEALVSGLVRINYAYDNKYLFSVSERTDGSSRFGPNNRYAYFPSVSAGWRISNEKFWPQNNVIDNVKLRASYGATGNKKIGDYKYFSIIDPTYAVLGDGIAPGFQKISLANPNLKWERTFSTNLGSDFTLFNKMNVTVDYYNTLTDRLLLNLPILYQTGYSTYPINKGKVKNEGFEFEINMPLIMKKNFKWTISANGYTNKNTLLDFGGSDYQINQGDPKRPNFFYTKVGSPLVQYYGYKMDSSVSIKNTNYWPIGVTSIHAFAKDIDKNGVINDSDRTILGNPYPKFNWGFTSNIQVKNFDISITIQGSHGAKVFNIDPYYFETQFGTTGTTAYLSQGYTAAQQAMLVQKFQTNANIESASFVAVRNLNIGYSLPTRTLRKMRITKMRFYTSAANLFYLFPSDYASFNPEADNGFTGDPLRKGYQRGAVPLARTITFGLNLDF